MIRRTFLALTASVVPFSAPAFADGHVKDIVDTAVGAGSFTTLVAAVQAAGHPSATKLLHPGLIGNTNPQGEAMNRKPFLTFGAIVAVAVIGAASIPAIAGGGPWGMMGGMTGGHGPGMTMQGGEGAGHGPMGRRDGHAGMGMSGLAEISVLQSFDADRDGKVTAAEAEAGVAALLTTHDADRNGALSEAEFATLFAKVTKAMAARPFATLDDDGNKRISAEEVSLPVK